MIMAYFAVDFKIYLEEKVQLEENFPKHFIQKFFMRREHSEDTGNIQQTQGSIFAKGFFSTEKEVFWWKGNRAFPFSCSPTGVHKPNPLALTNVHAI
jgi:hypothetical protein